MGGDCKEEVDFVNEFEVFFDVAFAGGFEDRGEAHADRFEDVHIITSNWPIVSLKNQKLNIKNQNW